MHWCLLCVKAYVYLWLDLAIVLLYRMIFIRRQLFFPLSQTICDFPSAGIIRYFCIFLRQRGTPFSHDGRSSGPALLGHMIQAEVVPRSTLKLMYSFHLLFLPFHPTPGKSRPAFLMSYDRLILLKEKILTFIVNLAQPLATNYSQTFALI